MKAVFFIMPLLLWLPLMASAKQGSEFVGYAYDLKTGELQYQERHRRELDDVGNKVVYTEYIDANDQIMAKRVVRYKQDRVSKFELSDVVNQETVSVERLSEKVILKKQLSSENAENRELKLSVELDHIIDAGFNDYVLKHWDELTSGKKKQFNFLSTERKRWIKLSVKGAGSREDAGFTIRSFQMTVANPVIRLLMKPIKVEYYADTRELYRYEGISNLKRDNGKNYSVRIEFPREDYQALTQQP